MIDKSKEAGVEQTLQLADRVSRELLILIPKEMLNSDLMVLTMAQFKIVLLLFITETARMSLIAQELGVSLSTATGIVDRLVEKGIVVRQEDPNDRRIVLCKLTEKGKNMLNGLWRAARNGTRELLMAVPEAKLPLVDEALKVLSAAGQKTQAVKKKS